MASILFYSSTNQAQVFLFIHTHTNTLDKITLWNASWETYMQDRKQQLELDMEQQTGSK